jgi:hypothetical protein
MPAPVVAIAALAGFAVVTIAVAVLNGGWPIDVGGVFPVHGRSDWPHGVQEHDVPRFAVDHLDTLRPGDPADSRLIQELRPTDTPAPRPEPVVTTLQRLVPGGRRG